MHGDKHLNMQNMPNLGTNMGTVNKENRKRGGKKKKH